MTALATCPNERSSRVFRKSEIGEIPADWDAKPLSAISDMKSGEGITARLIDDHSPYPCFGGNGLRGYTRTFTHDGPYVLIGRQGALCGNVNLVSGKFFASEHAIVVTPKTETAVRWLGYVLTSLNLNRYSESSAQPGLSVDKIKKLTVATPPTKIEQEAIAEALSDADALIESLEVLIAKKRAVKQGAMQHLLSGRKRLPGFSGEWRERELRCELVFQPGFPLPSSGFNKDYIGARVIRNRDLKSHDDCLFFSETFDNSYLVADGDLLVGMDGEFILKIWDGGPAVLNQRVGRILTRPSSNSVFLFYFLAGQLKKIEETTSGTTVKHLSHSDVESLVVKLPRREEQDQIADVLASIDAEISLIQRKLAKVRKIKMGMMQELLTGRVRLV